MSFKRKGEEKQLIFHVTASDATPEGHLSAIATVNGREYNFSLITIKYDHIPQQSVLLPASVKASRIDVTVKAKNVGYIMGAGDDIPAALRQIGCTVTLLEDKDYTTERLSTFDAIVVGIRAYNTKNGLKFHHEKLLEYTKNGGTLLVQYNNNFDLVLDKLAPFPMKLGRTRVTDETAEMRFRIPEHPILNTPNKLSSRDFDGWVQERGLYFPVEWDAAFQAPFSCNDPEEKPADGSVLIAPYGKGYYIYTGLSFFRELPAGVPGAYRLFANMISVGR
jgi:hypothetical protein